MSQHATVVFAVLGLVALTVAALIIAPRVDAWLYRRALEQVGIIEKQRRLR